MIDSDAGGSNASPPDEASTWRPDAAWFDRAHKAMLADFGDCPERKRAMVQFLFDAGFYDARKLTFAAGVQRFTDCLHPGKPNKFSITEFWALSRAFGRFQTIGLMAEDMGAAPLRIVELVCRVLAVSREYSERLAHLMAGTGYAPPRDTRMHPHLRDAVPVLSLAEPDDADAIESIDAQIRAAAKDLPADAWESGDGGR